MRAQKIWRLAMGCGLSTAIVLTGCSSQVDKSASQMTSYSSGTPGGEKAQLFTLSAEEMQHVKVVTLAPVTLTRTLRLSGAVAYNAFRTTPVITQVGGPVSRILVAPGQFVHKGEPLLDITSPDYSQMRSAYLKARDTYRVADKNYLRAQDLYAHNAIAERDLLQAESDRNLAQADLQSSEAALRILGIPKPESLGDLPPSAEIPLLSPMDGEIVERLVAPGQLLQAGATQAFTISDMSTVWVLVNVYQQDLPFVKVGDTVAIETDAYPGAFQGKISYIAAALDPNTRTLQARVVTNNPGGKLKKDMYVTASVAAGTIANALVVPDSAVLRDTENFPYVYVATGKDAQGRLQFSKRVVQIGQSQSGQTQITKGLAAGDQVIADGSIFVQFKNSLQQ
ncbi:MAG: efflux RND transporter periplasmic adaptor subunit [Candidatus Acidiferrales bacterium]